MKKSEGFDIYLQVIENMSDEKVTVYTSPANKNQLECMIMHLQGLMKKHEGEVCNGNCNKECDEECDE